MDSRFLRALVLVAETGSFTKTAQNLHITQSAISQRIKWLEDYFGRELFQRTSTRLILTEAGQIVLEKAKGILALEDQIRDELESLGRPRPLRVSSTPVFGMIHLPKALNAFMLRNYDVTDIQMLFHLPVQALTALRDGTIDLAIIEHCGRIDFEEFATYDLPDDDLVFLSSPALGIPVGACDLDPLLKHPLYIRKEGCSSRSLLETNLEERSLRLGNFQKVIVVDGLLLMIEAVVAGAGVAFISRSLVERQLAEGILREHRIEGFHHARFRTLAVHWDRRQDPAVSAFVECIFSALQLPPPAPPG